MKIAEKLFGTHSDRELKIVNPIVDKIEAMRDSMMALSDEELRDKTKEYKKRLEEGETLDDLLPEAFATVRGSKTWKCTARCGICGRLRYFSIFTVTIIWQKRMRMGKVREFLGSRHQHGN